MTNAEVRAMLRGDPPTKPIVLAGAQQLGLPATPRMTKEQIIMLIDGHLAGLTANGQCPWQPPRLEPLPGIPTPRPTAPRPAIQVTPIQPTEPIIVQPIAPEPTTEQLMGQFRREQDAQMVNRINVLVNQWNAASTPEAKNLIKIQVDGFKDLLHDQNLKAQIPDIPMQTTSATPLTPPAQPEEKKSLAQKLFGKKVGKWLDDLDEGGIG